MLSLRARGHGYGKHVSDGVASRTVRTTTVTRVSITEDAATLSPPPEPPAAAPHRGGLVAAGRGLRVRARRRRRRAAHDLARDARDPHHDLPRARRSHGRSGWTSGTPTWRSTAARRRSRSGASTASRSASATLERHNVDGGTLNVVSRCPDQVLGSCNAVFRITIPDNVPVRDRDRGRLRTALRRARDGPGQHRLRADRGHRLLRLLDARTLGLGRRERGRRMLGGPPRAALARGRRARRRSARALPGRRADPAAVRCAYAA